MKTRSAKRLAEKQTGGVLTEKIMLLEIIIIQISKVNVTRHISPKFDAPSGQQEGARRSVNSRLPW
jgi:hypothetical protein